MVILPHLFLKVLGKMFNKDETRVVSENNKKYVSFKVKINVKLAKVTNKNCEEVRNNIKLRFIDSCRFMVSSLDKLTNNLYKTTMILCDKCKSDMKLVNLSSR